MIAEKELLSSTISKETLKVQIENGLREGGAEERGPKGTHRQFQRMGAQDHNKWLSSPLG